MKTSPQDRTSIANSLAGAEDALREGRDLKGTGFWKTVSILRGDRQLASEFAARCADIDRRAFEASVRLRISEALGVLLLGAATVAGAAAVVLSSVFSGLLGPLVFLAGFGALDVATHSLTHWLVGRLVGIRFTHFFVGGPPPPRPGAKVDYESYLLVPPKSRAVMHASGAVVTKLVPFGLVPAALSSNMPRWVLAILLVAGVGQVLTDIAFSTKNSDWKKVIRELRAARDTA